MPAPLKFRQSVTTKPTTTEVKNSPLSNIEIDGNMHSLQDAIVAIEADNWVTTTRVLDSNITPSKLSTDGLGFRYRIGIYSDNSNTASTVITKGTTAQRDASPQEGFFRYNTTIGRIEWRNATDWVSSLKTNDTINIGTTSVSLDRASGALTLNGVTVDNSSNIATTDDISTNTTYYPVFSTATSGNTPVKVSSTKLTYNPSTGTLTSTNFVGDGSSLTNIPLTSTTGTLSVSRGGTGVTTLTGIVKASGTSAFAAATAGTDYLAPPTGTAIQKANSGGALVNAVAGTDYVSPSGTETITNKTIGLATNTINGITASSFVITDATGKVSQTSTKAIPSGDVVGTSDTQTLSNKTISNATFTDGYIEENVTANTGPTYTIDLSQGTLQFLTLTGSCTYTFPTAIAGRSFTIVQKQDSTGGRSVTWPSSVKWPSSSTPKITSTANKADMFSFTSDGTNWYGRVIGQNYL